MKREDALREAAALHLRAGNMAAYCDAMASVGEWDLATAVAPAVSLDFWAALVERRAAAATAAGRVGWVQLAPAVDEARGCCPARSWTLSCSHSLTGVEGQGWVQTGGSWQCMQAVQVLNALLPRLHVRTARPSLWAYQQSPTWSQLPSTQLLCTKREAPQPSQQPVRADTGAIPSHICNIVAERHCCCIDHACAGMALIPTDNLPSLRCCCCHCRLRCV